LTDDAWRRPRHDEDEDFGPPLFDDAPTGELQPGELSFGDSDTGPLPHWTAPPTGEMPRVLAEQAADQTDDDLDVWSSFGGKAPAWRDDRTDDDVALGREIGEATPAVSAGGRAAFDDDMPEPVFARLDDITDESIPVRREPGRITIGTDPTGDGSRPLPRTRGRSGEPAPRNGARPVRAGAGAGRPTSISSASSARGTAGRDMPTAVAVGIAMAAVFVGALMWKPIAVLAVVVAVLGLAAVEYFDKVTEKGYQPATVAGIIACVGLPIATYWVGETAIPLVLVLAFAAGCAAFIGAEGLESAPMPNMAISSLGVAWIGMMGSFAVLILRFSTTQGPFLANAGTDTLALLAIGVVANDVGAFFIGSAAGRTPLRAWISPNKSVEGFIGGTILTIGVLALIGFAEKSDTWNSVGDLVLLGVVIAITAPLGDLTESMFKRNLDVKDFGSLVKGHGGVLDRFDGFLFTLPATYYLLVVLQPWLTK
jgi:phosphatidate cytidylyltransferase